MHPIASLVLGLIIGATSLFGFVMFNKPASERWLLVENIYREQKGKLLELLKGANDELLGKEGDISLYSSHDSYLSFANDISSQALVLEQNDADLAGESLRKIKAAIQELYEVFLPTSDWDDAGGSASIANEILAILKKIMGYPA
jgi:hypothetical protein